MISVKDYMDKLQFGDEFIEIHGFDQELSDGWKCIVLDTTDPDFIKYKRLDDGTITYMNKKSMYAERSMIDIKKIRNNKIESILKDE